MKKQTNIWKFFDENIQKLNTKLDNITETAREIRVEVKGIRFDLNMMRDDIEEIKAELRTSVSLK